MILKTPLNETPNTWENDYLHCSQGLKSVRVSSVMFGGWGGALSLPAWEKHFQMKEKGQHFLPHSVQIKKIPPKAQGLRGEADRDRQTDTQTPLSFPLPLSLSQVSTKSSSSVLSFPESLKLVTHERQGKTEQNPLSVLFTNHCALGNPFLPNLISPLDSLWQLTDDSSNWFRSSV